MFGFESLIAPVVGSVLGGVMGGGDNTATTTQTPQFALPEQRKGYEQLIADAMKLYNTQQFSPVERTRVQQPKTAYDLLFSNPELYNLQQTADQKLAVAKGELTPDQQQQNALGYKGEYQQAGTNMPGELNAQQKWLMDNYGTTDLQKIAAGAPKITPDATGGGASNDALGALMAKQAAMEINNQGGYSTLKNNVGQSMLNNRLGGNTQQILGKLAAMGGNYDATRNIAYDKDGNQIDLRSLMGV